MNKTQIAIGLTVILVMSSIGMAIMVEQDEELNEATEELYAAIEDLIMTIKNPQDLPMTEEPILPKLIKTWTGSSDKTTDLFYVPTKQVRISWAIAKTSSYTQLMIVITNPQKTYFEYWAIENDLLGETYAYLRPGNYYLEISAINVKYVVMIESVTR